MDIKKLQARPVRNDILFDSKKRRYAIAHRFVKFFNDNSSTYVYPAIYLFARLQCTHRSKLNVIERGVRAATRYFYAPIIALTKCACIALLRESLQDGRLKLSEAVRIFRKHTEVAVAARSRSFRTTFSKSGD